MAENKELSKKSAPNVCRVSSAIFESAADRGTRISFFVDIKALNAGGESAF